MQLTALHTLVQKSSVIILGVDPIEGNVKRQLVLAQNVIAVMGESVTLMCQSVELFKSKQSWTSVHFSYML